MDVTLLLLLLLLTDALVLGRVGSLVQLELCLDVLRGEGDADLDATRQAT